jgi:hypothetical protein
MNVRDLIKNDFGVDLPIKGGIGNSIDDPVIVEQVSPINDYVGTEYAYLKYIGIGRGIEWETVAQQLLTHSGRKMDKIKIETKQMPETEIITQIEKLLF